MNYNPIWIHQITYNLCFLAWFVRYNFHLIMLIKYNLYKHTIYIYMYRVYLIYSNWLHIGFASYPHQRPAGARLTYDSHVLVSNTCWWHDDDDMCRQGAGGGWGMGECRFHVHTWWFGFAQSSYLHIIWLYLLANLHRNPPPIEPNRIEWGELGGWVCSGMQYCNLEVLKSHNQQRDWTELSKTSVNNKNR